MAPPSVAAGRRAPAFVGWLFAVAVGLAIVLLGPLLLFNPWFVAFEQARNDVPAAFGTSQSQVDRVTGAMLCDLFLGCSDFGEGLDAGPPLLTSAERSHMEDVGRLVRVLVLVLAVAMAGIIAGAAALRRERRRVGGLLLGAALGTGTAALVIGLFFAVAFDQAFLLFHRVFFPEGNFLFGPDSNLIRLFPEGLWFEASLAAGAIIVASAAITAVVGLRLTRTPPQS